MSGTAEDRELNWPIAAAIFALSAARASFARIFSRAIRSLIIVLIECYADRVINSVVTSNGFEVIMDSKGKSGLILGWNLVG